VTSSATVRSTSAASRTWAGWLLAGVALVLVAVATLVWPAAGPRLLLGAAGTAGLVRGTLLVRAADVVLGGARAIGLVTGGLGAVAIGVAAVSGELSARVLLAVVPLLLLLVGGALAGRDGVARRAGSALLAGGLLLAAVLVAVGLTAGWAPAAGLATGLGALAAALLAAPVLVASANLRAAAAAPAPARPAACASCACGSGGGCGALERA
jgi:hypothetical protein